MYSLHDVVCRVMAPFTVSFAPHTSQKQDDETPTVRMSSQLITVRMAQGGARARQHQFEIVTANEGRYEFRAESKEDLDAWLRTIQCSIQCSLEQLPSLRAAIVPSSSLPGREVNFFLSINTYMHAYLLTYTYDFHTHTHSLWFSFLVFLSSSPPSP